MALVAWYKLDGNALDSSGNGHHGTNFNGTFVNGRIGQAVEITGSQSYIDTGFCPGESTLGHSFSWAFWKKYYRFANNIGSSGNYGDEPRFYTQLTSTTGDLRVAIGNDFWVATTLGNDLLNQWVHICITFNHGEVRTYINGELVNTKLGIVFEGETLPAHSVKIGRGFQNGRSHEGQVDDMRIYDHALSPKEVKELAKAKILHYKFDDFQEPTQNILGTITPSYSKWGTNEGTSTYFTAPNGNQGVCLEITSFTDGGVNWYNTGGQRNAEPSTQYTVSATIKYEGGTPHRNLLYLRQYRSDGTQISEAGQFSTSYIEDLGNGWYRAYRTFTTHAECAKLAIQGYEYKKIKIWIYDIQCEKKAYHTPYVANDRAGVIYDCSGYDNHAELQLETTPRWTSEAKIGDGAYDFAGVGKAISFIKPIPKLQEFTLSAWVYNVQGDSRQSIIRNFWEVVGTSIAFWSYDFTDEYWRQSPSGVVPYGRWTHIATTWDGSVIRHYANGELVYTSATSSGTSQEFLGIAGYSGRNFSGKLDDVRIYATALSDDDIKELYQTRVALDSHGNLYASEVMDLDSKILSNGGHVWDFRYGLTSISGLKPLGVE